MHKFIFALVGIFLLTVSCKSPRKTLETGNYDSAIDQAVKQLRGDKRKNPETVRTLEIAFQKATQQDMREAGSLKNRGIASDWPRIVRIYERIERRQDQVEPLLPLEAKDGYRANFKFVKTPELLAESREKAAKFFYDNGQRMLREAATDNDVLKAREAHAELERIRQYFDTYRDIDRLQEEAHQLGTTRATFRFRNGSNAVLPRDFERELLRSGTADLNSFWREYHAKPVAGVDYDYEIVMNLTGIEVTPEIVKEREYTDSKEIKDGFDYVLDENGNVAKDTSGNDIKVDRFINVYADVIEVLQNKNARLSGRLEYFDARTGNLLVSEPLAAEAIFENYASTFQGDRRALSKETKQRLGNEPRPFPTDEELLLQAAQQLKPVIKRLVRNNTIIE